MANASLTLSASLTINEGTSEVAERSFSGDVNLDEHTELFDSLDPSAADKSISLGGLTGFDFLYLETDGDILIRLGDVAADQISVKAHHQSGDVKKGVFMLETDNVDSLFASNPSATASVKVRYVFAKKAA